MKREAIVTVVEEFNRRHRMAELVKYSGTFSDRFPTNDEIEAVDAAKVHSLDLAHDDAHVEALAKLVP